jgi:hypothetical protein
MNEVPLTFLTDHVPPEKRQRFCENGVEKKFSEGAVQIAFALYLLSQPEGGQSVEMFPDGEHAKRFAIREYLESMGFVLEVPMGSTSYGGLYRRGEQSFTVNPKSHHGRGDVVGTLKGQVVRAECKGGIINSKHSGALSKLRSGMSELIGQTMAMDDNGDRHVAVAPKTTPSLYQAQRLHKRCNKAGIEIALVSEDGSVEFITSDT